MIYRIPRHRRGMFFWWQVTRNRGEGYFGSVRVITVIFDEGYLRLSIVILWGDDITNRYGRAHIFCKFPV